MKILFLTPWYPDSQKPNHGTFIRDQAAALAQNHRVVLISAKIDYHGKIGIGSYTVNRTNYQGIEEHRLVINHSLPLYNQLNYFLVAVNYAKKVAAEFLPDLVHGNISYPGAYWSYRVAQSLSIPYVFTEHTRLTNNFRSVFHKFMAIRYLKKADRMITVSKCTADEMNEIVKKPVLIIPNIVRYDRFKNVKPVSPDKTPRFGFLGGLDTPVKGLDLLLKATAAISVPFELHIGGEGILKDSYVRLARELGVADRCHFHGFVRHDEVPEFMSRLNFFVSSSRYESFGLVIVEAMACGLPVVATASGGPNEYVNELNGILIKPEDISGLSHAINIMMTKFQNYDPEAIRKFVVNNFSEGNFLAMIESVYNSVIRDPR